MAYVPLADQDHEQELHHPHSWVINPRSTRRRIARSF